MAICDGLLSGLFFCLIYPMMYLLKGRKEMSLVTMAETANVMMPVSRMVRGVAIHTSHDDKREVMPW